jgi:hypothetical protein
MDLEGQTMIPEVKKCDVTDCFYNKDMQCNAHGITVGSADPFCETYLPSSQQRTSKRGDGEIGACHVSNCTYNDNMYCHACGDIDVGKEGDKAVCKTYTPQ